MNKTKIAGKERKTFLQMQEKGIFLHEFQYPLALFEDIEKALQTDRLVQSEKLQVNDLIDQYSAAAKEIRKVDPDAKIIMTSGDVSKKFGIAKLKVEGFIQKPYSFNDLSEIISKVLS